MPPAASPFWKTPPHSNFQFFIFNFQFMIQTPPIIARRNSTLAKKMQEGHILSHTTVRTGNDHRTIALIELNDGSRILAPLIEQTLDVRHKTSENSLKSKVLRLKSLIGEHVSPHLRLQEITPDGLRVYDVAYEVIVRKKLPTFEESVFPRYILAFTGPSGVGKSTVSTALATLCHTYLERVPILTTRKPKKGDDGEYVHVTRTAFDALKHQTALAATADIPSKTEQRSYGYRKTDFEEIWKKGKIPVVVTEMHLLQGLAATFGRRSILSFGLLPPGKSRRAMLSSLLFRLRERGRETEHQIHERLKNAVVDLAFFKSHHHLFDHLIVNEKLEHVIEKLKPHIPGLVKFPLQAGEG